MVGTARSTGDVGKSCTGTATASRSIQPVLPFGRSGSSTCRAVALLPGRRTSGAPGPLGAVTWCDGSAASVRQNTSRSTSGVVATVVRVRIDGRRGGGRRRRRARRRDGPSPPSAPPPLPQPVRPSTTVSTGATVVAVTTGRRRRRRRSGNIGGDGTRWAPAGTASGQQVAMASVSRGTRAAPGPRVDLLELGCAVSRVGRDDELPRGSPARPPGEGHGRPEHAEAVPAGCRRATGRRAADHADGRDDAVRPSPARGGERLRAVDAEGGDRAAPTIGDPADAAHSASRRGVRHDRQPPPPATATATDAPSRRSARRPRHQQDADPPGRH